MTNAPDPLVSCAVMPPAPFVGTVLAPLPAVYGLIAVSAQITPEAGTALLFSHACPLYVLPTPTVIAAIPTHRAQIEASSIRDHYAPLLAAASPRVPR